MGGHLLWAAGIALPCRFELSFVLVQRHTVLSEDVRATARQNFIQTRGKSEWQQLVTYSNGPRCFVLLRKPLWACYTLRHLFLASFSFCSFQVDAYTCTAQSVRALGVTKRNCSVNSRHNVECWKWSQLMKDLCVRVFVCLNIACLVDICFFQFGWWTQNIFCFCYCRDNIYSWNSYGDNASVVYVSECCWTADYDLSSLCGNSHSNALPSFTWAVYAGGQV